MGSIFRKIKKNNQKKKSQKLEEQNKKIISLFGASDAEIDDFFDNHYDTTLLKQSHPTPKRIKKAPVKSIFDEDHYPGFETDRYWCTKKYILTRKFLQDGSTKYSFNITDSKPYLRTRAKVIRPNLTRNKLRNKFVFEVLKKKNLYYLKKPFEELTLYIAPISMRVLMNCVHTGERLYMREAIEFYLNKYHIPFQRYRDDSKLRVRKHRQKLK
ncbi:MAG TPA: hypothetical protein ENK66_04820 [Arcobacter sp.]|nr:hypothetical protein [Arcobacter sp.]